MDNKKVLIVIDMQNDFVTGALENSEAQGITGQSGNLRMSGAGGWRPQPLQRAIETSNSTTACFIIHHLVPFIVGPDTGLCPPHDGFTFRRVILCLPLPCEALPGILRLGLGIQAAGFRRRFPAVPLDNHSSVCGPLCLQLPVHIVQTTQE